MIEIKPALISGDFNEVRQKIEDLETLCQTVHLDVSDGLFSPLVTRYVPDDLYDLTGRIKIEAHLMAKAPEESLPYWAAVVDRVIVHAEAVADLETVLESLKPHHTKVGVALLLDSPLSEIKELLPQIELVQLMSIKKIGGQGEKLDEAIYRKIEKLRAMYDGIIQIDGGVTLQNAPELIAVGANSLVVGSAIWRAVDYVKAIENFQDLS
jgi:ribulose-phosphate 3-epimerase